MGKGLEGPKSHDKSQKAPPFQVLSFRCALSHSHSKTHTHTLHAHGCRQSMQGVDCAGAFVVVFTCATRLPAVPSAASQQICPAAV